VPEENIKGRLEFEWIGEVRLHTNHIEGKAIAPMIVVK
jgi:hypothetical protein